MKYNDKYASKLILRKSGSYLKLSLLIFITMIALLCFSLLFYISYSNDTKNNYTENEIVHILSVEGKFENNSYRNLRSKDKLDISNLLQQKKIAGSVGFLYSICGASINDEMIVNIVGVDEEAWQYITSSKMKDNTFYTNDIVGDEIQVDIPIISVDENGNVNSSKFEKIVYPRENIIAAKVIDYFSHDYEDLYKIYVSENTFMDILKTYSSQYSDIASIYDDFATDNIIVDSAYVNIDDLYEIDFVAEFLSNQGYDINYTFSAFDEMGISLQKNGILFVMMVIILLIVASINLIFSFVAYIDMSRKDIGIMKFMGFDNKRIYSIYSRNINKIFGLLWLVAIICICVLTLITIDTNYLKVILFLSLGVGVLLLSLDGIINVYYLQKVVKKNLLYLI